MHRQHDADGEAGGEDQRRGAVPELKDVPKDFARLIGRSNGLDHGAPAECGERPYELKEAENAGTDAVDHRHV
jgi:hypothetical protein